MEECTKFVCPEIELNSSKMLIVYPRLLAEDARARFAKAWLEAISKGDASPILVEAPDGIELYQWVPGHWESLSPKRT